MFKIISNYQKKDQSANLSNLINIPKMARIRQRKQNEPYIHCSLLWKTVITKIEFELIL